jgi:hypothetical protein
VEILGPVGVLVVEPVIARPPERPFCVAEHASAASANWNARLVL